MWYKVKKRYVGTNLVRPDTWTPWSNTVAYYKFDWNMNDSSWNNRNLSVAQWTFTYWTLSQWAKYIQTNFNSYSSQISSFPLNSNSATISFWMSFVNWTAWNWNTSSTYWATVFDLMWSNGLIRPCLSWWYNDGYLTYWFCYLDVTNHYVPSVSESWHLYTIVLNWWTASIYMDWVLWKTWTYPVNNWYSFRLNTVDWDSTQRRQYSSRDKLSELIFENKQWTAQEVQDYYNKTKSNYIWWTFEYSYNFTTWSVTDLQNKGWTVPSGSVVNSSGYYNSNKNRWRLKISSPQLQAAAQTATKVTYWLSWTASWFQQRSFSLVNWSTEICTLYWDWNSPTGGNSAMFWNQSLVSEDGYSYWRNGTFTTTVTVDLVNKTRKYEWTNHTTLTWTVTDTAITNFRTVNGLQVYWEQTVYITSIWVKVE